MLNWVITFFIAAVLATLLGFSGLDGAFAEIAKLLALIFVLLFVGSLVFSVLTGRRISPLLP
jgi:uncharacterized membrane protein YtjA (UPF0391 family)